MRRNLGRAALVAALVALVLVPVGASADPPIRIGPSYPPGPCLTVHIKIHKVINQKVIVTGCSAPLADLDIFIQSEPQFLGEIKANADGTFTKTFQLPANLEPGTHHVVAKVEGQPEARSQAFSLDAASSARSGRSPIGLLGLAIVGIGLALIASTVRWRRRLSPASGVRVRRGEARPEVPFIDTSGFVPFSSSDTESDRPKGVPESRSDRNS